ncbi:MAG: cell wall metabolism sensor histidine kinase WalK, partial [Thiovulaceae bacterium]|nr:cell wall metabolism sensor histidine kinase WalK [Sulfurimonadaceae bacterium]
MKKIKIVIALIFVLSILIAVIFNHLSEQRRVSNNLLNVINQQKAFTQEIAKNIFYIYKNKSASDKQLDDSIKKFLSNMQNRDRNLQKIDSKALKEHSDKIVILWNKFYLEVQNFRDLNKVTVAYSSLILEELVNTIYN